MKKLMYIAASALVLVPFGLIVVVGLYFLTVPHDDIEVCREMSGRWNKVTKQCDCAYWDASPDVPKEVFERCGKPDPKTNGAASAR